MSVDTGFTLFHANTSGSILSRAHSNYLAQLNIAMNERAEQTGDVLGKLTVLGSMVLPLNIVTGMWGLVSLLFQDIYVTSLTCIQYERMGARSK